MAGIMKLRIIVAFLASDLLVAWIVNQLYKIQKVNPQDGLIDKNQATLSSNLKDDISISNDTSSISFIEIERVRKKKRISFDSYWKLSQQLDANRTLNDEDIDNIVVQTKAMSPFTLKMSDYTKGKLNSICRLFTCCRRQTKTEKKFKLKSNAEILDECKPTIKKQFDIIRILKELNDLKIFMGAFLTNRQKMLMKFQRKKVLSEVEDNADSLSDDEFASVPLLDRDAIIAKTLKQALASYRTDVPDRVDIVLLKGIF